MRTLHRASATIILKIVQIVFLLCIHMDSGNAGTGSSVPPLLFATPRDIRLVHTNRTNAKVKVQILVRNLTEGVGLDINYAAQTLCWTDHGLEMIQCVSYNGLTVENKTEIITTGLISPDGLACDWFTNKLYWTDLETNRIEVATMSGEHRKVLFWSEIDQPRSIVLAPMRGIMFWSDWGEVPKIERAGMNGDPGTRRVIVSDNIFWPNGLTVDYEHELLYLIDGKLLFIDVMDYEGRQRRRILDKGLYYPFAITQFENKLYWTDWNTWSVHYCEKNTTAEPKELIHSDLVPMYIQAWDASRQPAGRNPCQQDNGGCSHLCLLAPYPPGYTCDCPYGIRLLDNYTCAAGPQEILLLATKTDIILIYLDSPDYTHKAIPLQDIKHTIAIDYDVASGYVYWTDDEVKKIRRAMLNGTDQEDVIVDNVYHPDGLAVDWVAENLYWTDTGSDRIEVSRLNGKHRRVLLYQGLIQPRAIVVAPEHGWMFWSDWNEKQPKIERASLDGSDRTELVNTGLGWPNGITLDLQHSKIYWCDAKIDRIEVANMDGTDRIELTSDNLPHSFGLSLMGEYVYWTDWQRRSIDRVHKSTGANRETVIEQMPNVMGLKAVHLGASSGTNPCKNNNGGCAHLCLNRPNSDYVCACQMTYELQSDQRTCVLPDSFLLFAKNETIGRISIENGNNDKNDAIIPVSGVKHASSLDFDLTNARMYWAGTNGIYRAYVNGSDSQRVVELAGGVACVAVDWLAHNLYWTDVQAGKVEVARVDGSSRRALVWGAALQEPRGLALDPAQGYMYWSEWGSVDCIKRATLNGSQAVTLVANAGYARDLTLDDEERVLYWATEHAPVTINAVNLVGRGVRRTLVHSKTMIVGLTMYRDKVYWSETGTGDIYAADKASGVPRTVLHARLPDISDLLVVHAAGRQHQWNQCSVDNGGCTSLCLALPGGAGGAGGGGGGGSSSSTTHTCACPTHYTLANNSCIAPTSFMIYSQRNAVVRLLPDSADYPEAVLPIQGLNRLRAVDFDPVSHYLYWIEGKTHSIKRALDNGSKVSVVVEGGSSQMGGPYDLAIDSLGRLLFWTCSIQDVINVTRLDNGSTVGVVVKKHGEKPRLLAIHPTKRLLFWTDSGTEPQLVRARLDGSHRIAMIRPKQNITAIALDLDTDMMVWAEGLKLYMCNIDGENKHSVLSETRLIINQMAIHGGYMYWLDRSHNQLRKFNLQTGQQEPVRLSHTMLLTDLVSVREPASNHSCAQGHHRCSHICIGNATTVLCACPQGLALQDDRRTCSTVPDCGTDHFTCGRNRHTFTSASKDCIPASWRCDGQHDCQDGSDEADCPTCRADQFRCQSGECIDQALVCDGERHCQDGGDEERCCNSKEEFKCPQTDVCLAVLQVCDGMDHCANGADESEAACASAMAGNVGGGGSGGSGGSNGHKVSGTGNSNNGGSMSVIVVVLLTLLCAAAVLFLFLVFYCRKRFYSMTGRRRHHLQHYRDGAGAAAAATLAHDHAEDPLSPNGNHRRRRGAQMMLMIKPASGNGRGRNKGCVVPPPDLVHMSMLNGSGDSQCMSSYERSRHITGASSSTNDGSSSLTCYPRETLNPPPSPATTAASTRGSSPSRYRPYRHYRSINQPPPPTPCSTDVCDESDYNNYAPPRSRYADSGPFPPPPTPRSHCHSESCPPSPSSRSSTYFSPLPPPPSPVPYRGGGGGGGYD